MTVDRTAKVEDILRGHAAEVEILKVLLPGGDTLDSDEPTASLTPQEIEGLMESIEKSDGGCKSVILIHPQAEGDHGCALQRHHHPPGKNTSGSEGGWEVNEMTWPP